MTTLTGDEEWSLVKNHNLGGECECRSLRGVKLATVSEIIYSNYQYRYMYNKMVKEYSLEYEK